MKAHLRERFPEEYLESLQKEYEEDYYYAEDEEMFEEEMEGTRPWLACICGVEKSHYCSYCKKQETA